MFIVGEGGKEVPVSSVVLWGLVLWVECGGSGPVSQWPSQ